MPDIERMSELFGLDGRTVLVSGGARGIGAAICRTLHDLGAHVVCADLLTAEGNELVSDLGERARFALLDVTNEENWISAVSEANAWRDGLDVLVNCAGIAIAHTVDQFPRDEFEKVLNVNLVGTFLGMKHAARVMIPRRRGSIINLSSADGMQGANSMGAYAASKWGVRGLTKAASMELGLHGVRVNAICPGSVNTPMLNPNNLPIEEIRRNHSHMVKMPLQRIGEPSELASACAFLASDASSFVTGSDLVVDGGVTVGLYYKTRPGAPDWMK
ncbi:MAG: SDR family NAD(P)-dependent oxidoreductase [Thermomicrobiales bacterium]